MSDFTIRAGGQPERIAVRPVAWRSVAAAFSVAAMLVVGSGTDALADTGSPPTGRAAAVIDVLRRQGVAEREALRALAAVEVENPLPAPVTAVDSAIALTAAAALAPVPARDLALAAEPTVDAPVMTATSVAATAKAARAGRGTVTALAGRMTLIAAKTRRVVTVAIARQRAASFASAPAAAAIDRTPPAAASVSVQSRPGELPRAALPVLAGLLAAALWRRRSEPFVIKAKPAQT